MAAGVHDAPALPYCYYSNMWPAQPNRSLIDGLSCLQALALAGAPVGGRDLARRLALEPTRAHRLLKTLAHLGFARQDLNRKYAPGPAMHVLCAQSLFASGLLRRALNPLASLNPLRYVVALGLLWRDYVCYLYHALPGMPPGQALGRLGLYPATRSSIGLVLLACLPEDEVRQLYRGRPIPGFKGGIGELLATLMRTRRNGHSWLVHDRHPRRVTMAVPVGEPPEAAVALSGALPSARRGRLVRLLHTVADRIRKAPDPADAGVRLALPLFSGDNP